MVPTGRGGAGERAGAILGAALRFQQNPLFGEMGHGAGRARARGEGAGRAALALSPLLPLPHAAGARLRVARAAACPQRCVALFCAGAAAAAGPGQPAWRCPPPAAVLLGSARRARRHAGASPAVRLRCTVRCCERGGCGTLPGRCRVTRMLGPCICFKLFHVFVQI